MTSMLLILSLILKKRGPFICEVIFHVHCIARRSLLNKVIDRVLLRMHLYMRVSLGTTNWVYTFHIWFKTDIWCVRHRHGQILLVLFSIKIPENLCFLVTLFIAGCSSLIHVFILLILTQLHQLLSMLPVLWNRSFAILLVISQSSLKIIILWSWSNRNLLRTLPLVLTPLLRRLM